MAWALGCTTVFATGRAACVESELMESASNIIGSATSSWKLNEKLNTVVEDLGDSKWKQHCLTTQPWLTITFPAEGVEDTSALVLSDPTAVAVGVGRHWRAPPTGPGRCLGVAEFLTAPWQQRARRGATARSYYTLQPVKCSLSCYL